MSVIKQYSRISHHTLTNAITSPPTSPAIAFTVPTSEDFTDGSWTIYDLAQSEIGILEDTGEMFVRIGDEIKQVQLTGGGGTGSGVIVNTNDVIIKWEDILGTTIREIILDTLGVSFDFDGDKYTFPIGDGAADQVMVTDGAGQISWEDRIYERGSSGTESIKTVDGGTNDATANYATVSGGFNNLVSAQLGFIGAGIDNIVSGTSSSIVGGGQSGLGNTVSGDYAAILGGRDNSISNHYSIIVGGDGNAESGSTYAFIGAGQNNTITGGLRNVIVAGGSNIVSGQDSFIGAGQDNTISGTHSFIGGGSDNTASGSRTFIGGGNGNSITSINIFSTIVGGDTNSMTNGADWSFIGGGADNTITNTVYTNYYNFIGGGQLNTISGASSGTDYSVIVGGYNNSITSVVRSTIAGGFENVITGNNAVIGGGYQNEVSADNSSIQGGAYAVADRPTMRAYAGAQFGSTLGSAQQVDFVMSTSTTDATPTNLWLDGGSARLTIPSGKILAVSVSVAGGASGGTNAAHYMRKVMIRNAGGTTALVGAVQTIGTDVETVAGWDVTITADNTNDALDIKVTGAAATTINWVAHVTGVEIAYAA